MGKRWKMVLEELLSSCRMRESHSSKRAARTPAIMAIAALYRRRTKPMPAF
ncbi:hypothetical protein [Paenibacillus protaetiae]|uniref:hypothetical protein n=1 Tax=Paenibacillus protaetiae TaxID=2509456 RepID=UPI0013EA76B1|nr:hypothetical protein [Paenibacillus protaetiae]